MTTQSAYWEIYRTAYKHGTIAPETAQSIIQTYETEGRNKIYAAAKKKKLIPAIANLCIKLELDQEYWTPIVEMYRERNRKVVLCLDEMYRLLGDNGITRIAVVENFGALLASHEDIAMFGSGDVDEYADPELRESITAVLKKNGYTVTDTRVGSLYISTTISKPETFPDNFHFGINWDVTNRLNLPCFTSKGDFIEWARASKYAKTAIRLPSPEGLMYVCLMHISVHGFCKAPDIRLYYDIANAAEQQIDWQKIVNWAQRDGNCVKIATAAFLANRLLDVDIPEFVFEIGNKKQKRKLLKTCYDEETNCLKDFPGKIARIKIDIYSHDEGALKGMQYILFPNKEWIKAKYGSIFTGYIRHAASLL